MNRTQVYLPDDMYQDAKIFAEIEDITFSQYLRKGLAVDLQMSKENHKRKKPFADLIGTVNIPDGKDLSRNVDTIVYDF